MIVLQVKVGRLKMTLTPFVLAVVPDVENLNVFRICPKTFDEHQQGESYS